MSHTQMAGVMDTDELTPEQEADLAAIRARKKQIVTAHRIKKGVANNRCVCVLACVCAASNTILVWHNNTVLAGVCWRACVLPAHSVVVPVLTAEVLSANDTAPH